MAENPWNRRFDPGDLVIIVTKFSHGRPMHGIVIREYSPQVNPGYEVMIEGKKKYFPPHLLRVISRASKKGKRKVKRRVLISACVLGKNVRWSGGNKRYDKIKDWADANDIELVPVCPENDLFGTPRAKIRLRQDGEEVRGIMKGKDIFPQLRDHCEKILVKNADAVGFIGIANSPSCGISVGVMNRGSTMKAPMHATAPFPTTEVNSLRTTKGLANFLHRIEKYENR